ncbi:alpha/beta hydrolase [Gemmatimonadota bacterium]
MATKERPIQSLVLITAFRLVWFSFATVLLGVPPIHAQKATLQGHTVEVDGHPLAVWEKSPANPRGTIVLLHGRTWSSLPDFDLQVPGEDLSLMDGLVAEGWSAYAVDLRGYGETPRDDTQWLTPDRAARDVVGILRWVGERAGDLPALFGWSYGSMVAQLTVQRAGNLVSALILFGYPVGPDTDFSSGDPGPDEPQRTPTTPAAAASDFIIPGTISQNAIDEYVRHALEADPVRVDWRGLAEWEELNPSEIFVPTLLIQGEKDPLAPTARQAAFFSRLGTADRTWVTIAGGDHAAHLETPRATFIHAMMSFLRQPRGFGIAQDHRARGGARRSVIWRHSPTPPERLP